MGRNSDAEHEVDIPCATAHWAAPEVLRAEGHTKASDAWSLATVVWEIWTGLMPFAGMRQEFVAELVKCGEHPPVPDHVPDRVRRLMLGGWVKSVPDRMDTDEMLRLLEQEIRESEINTLDKVHERDDSTPAPTCATRSSLRRQQQEAVALSTRKESQQSQ